MSKDYIVNTIFIGGGTPSILLPGEILTIMTTVRSIFKVAEDAEVTIEVNPGTLTSTKAAEYIEAGINRMSIGLQSANDEELAMLGRIHSFDQFLASYQTARQAGFDNINIDIMSALPGQTLHSYLDTVEKVLKCRPEHISSYSLIVEEGTPLAENKELLSRLPDEAEDREMYEATRKLLLVSGYKRYEISNYAKPGYECRHNKVYWTLGEYIGIGLGASSFLNSRRFSNTRDLMKYTNLYHQVEAENNFENNNLSELFANIRFIDEEVNSERMMEEFMICGLRMMSGVSAATFFEMFGHSIYDVYGSIINKYVASGHLKDEGGNIKLTTAGIDVSNVVLADFLLD
jgi:oxygen-independent coproporphyrinogen-3 oxidase